MGNGISVTTDFLNGGGSVSVEKSEPLTIRFSPHDEGDGGWSKMWWYFKVDGITPGEEIRLELMAGEGISPQAFFSYDQEVWGLTDVGETQKIDGKDCFVYKHKVRNSGVWFAYDLPYTSEHVDLLTPLINQDQNAEVFTLCRSKKNRENKGFRLKPLMNAEPKYGIWLQARCHAFESGASWVLHELTRWLLSDEPEAVELRNLAHITIIPIVDIDGVSEGRTGKYQKPHDHWMNWGDVNTYWPEIKAIQSGIHTLADKNMADFFIDFHGPGGKSHPYFIMPFAELLPSDKQRNNRSEFLKVLNANPLDTKAKQSQSMTRIHHSERPWDTTKLDSSHEWVTMKANNHSVAFTIEVNMNTPLSTQHGYQTEATVLGKAISAYFVGSNHLK